MRRSGAAWRAWHKLDALRRDGLITDSEYQAKRSEIVAERW